MSNLNSAAVELQEAWQRLRQCWTDTVALWNDPVRWDFEKQYWQPLEAQTQATQREMGRLAQLIVQARRSVK
jgi:hypothetical protein